MRYVTVIHVLRLSCFCLLLAAVSCLPLYSVQAQSSRAVELDFRSDSRQLSPSAASPTPAAQSRRKVTKKRFPGYGRYTALFKELCRKVQADGRSADFYRLAESQIDWDRSCAACRPLFKTMVRTCKSRFRERWREQYENAHKSTQSTTGEEEAMNEPGSDAGAEPEEVQFTFPPQREPSTETLYVALTLFRRIYEDGRIRDESVKSVRRLLNAFQEKDGLSRGAQDYFGLLATYIELPFKEPLSQLRAKERKKKEAKPSWHENPGAVDALFDFQ